MSLIVNLILVSAAFAYSTAWEDLPDIPSGRRSEFYVLHTDGGYKYGYDTGTGIAAKQTGDTSNQVEGHYFYKSPSGKDVDLKYTAGVQGFVPEGLESLQNVIAQTNQVQTNTNGGNQDDESNTGDASYSFTIDTDTYKRQENSDAFGNVKGRYSYSNEAGNHDLEYVAGSATGFLATSGSLSQPNGLLGKSSYAPSYTVEWNTKASPVYSTNSNNPDGSYSFAFSTDNHSRREASDANGNVQGSYSYNDYAGSHDLSYVAGANTGFRVTGGSLSIPTYVSNSLYGSSISTLPPSAYGYQISGYNPSSALSNTDFSAENSSSDNEANSGDASYNFKIDTDSYQREESADKSGNVQGRYSYQNSAGSHDLSYVAGGNTGFLATGGSLSIPNGLIGAYPSNIQVANIPEKSSDSGNDQANTGDASYSFNIDTDDYKRTESSDPSGNVQGFYSYKNNAGTHDLSYIAGSNTGFVATGGSLKTPPGLTEAQLNNYPLPVPSSFNSIGAPLSLPSTKTSYDIGNLAVRTYLPPYNEKHKFGYIFDTKH